MHSESLADVKVFLRDVLVQEKLSCTAERERQRLLRYLDSRESSPAPYLDMSPNNKNTKTDKDKNRTNEFYEECLSSKSSNTTDNSSDINKQDSNRNSSARSSSSLYYNIAQAFKSSSSWDINDDRPSVPQKETRNSSSNSTSTSTRNSMCSLITPLTPTKRAGTESPDALSEASSSASNNYCSSKNLPNTSPEVLTVSASALRYSASKCGILSRKEKFLFLDHYKQYWAGLLGHTLYVYSSDKDSKPILEVDIEGYQARPVGLKDSPKKESSFEIFCPGNKTYQFTAPCAYEMDQWIFAICQAGKVPDTTDTIIINTTPATTTKTEATHRELPSLPPELMYDQPDSVIRPVTPRSPEQYEIMNSNVDDAFYHYISNDKNHINESALYKNLEEMALATRENGEIDDNCNENLYYNLVPATEGENECIYDTIKESDREDKTLPVSGRIQQIIQKIEAAAAAAGNSTKYSNNGNTASLIQDELYEPVNSPEEKCSTTVSR